jgi:tetratricopeptide (TPR) repeat protein
MSNLQRSFVLVSAVSTVLFTAVLIFVPSDVDVEKLFREAQAVASGEVPENAIPLFDQVLIHNPENSKALLYRGQLAVQQGDPDAAIGFFSRIGNERKREAGTARYLEATAWYAKGHAQMAEQQFLAAIALHPMYLTPRESIVQLYYIQTRPAELQSQLDAIRAFRPWNLEELFASQAVWFVSSQPKETIPVLQGFVAADPGDIASRIALARHYLNDDSSEQAIGVLKRAKTLEPENLTVHGLLAECHLKASRFEAAWEELQSDVSEAENPAQWWRALGNCAYEAELWPEAVSALTYAVAGNRNDYEAAYRLGIAAQRSGQIEFAEQQLEHARATEKLSAAAIRLQNTSRSRLELLATSIFDVGQLLLQLGRRQESIPWFSTFLAMRPNHREGLALLNLANSDADDSSGIEPIEPDPGIVAAVGAAIRARKPMQPQPTQTAALVSVRLRDIHDEVGLDFQYFNGKADANYMLLQTVGGGVAVLDYDGDDCPDLFFPNGIELNAESSEHTDQLFRNIGGTRIERVTETAGVLSYEFGQGCVAFDYNNDGFQDLFVGTYGRILVYRNQGDGTFSEIAKEAGITGSRWTSSLAASDLDKDGDLDLYVVNYVKDPFLPCRDDSGKPVVCSPANFDAEQDLLFLNDGTGSFHDVTQTSGIQVPNGKGLGVIIADFDDDGRQDIYIANDGEQNFLFRNQTATVGGRLDFLDVGLTSGSAVSRDGRAQAGMGIACDDFDDDGRLDLYVTNFFQDYNTFYRNRGDLLFSDETQSLRLVNPTMGSLGFGTQSVDLDLDGHGEIIVANGHIHDRRFEGTPWQMAPHCFRRTPDGTYTEVSEQLGPYFRGEYIGRGLARLDFNGDHLPDVVVVHQDRPAALLVNETPQAGHALVLKLRGVQSNRDAVGARIEFLNGAQRRVVEVTGGNGYCASNERTLIIGTGAAKIVREVTIRWPSGQVDKLTDVPTNTNLMIRESLAPVILKAPRN